MPPTCSCHVPMSRLPFCFSAPSFLCSRQCNTVLFHMDCIATALPLSHPKRRNGSCANSVTCSRVLASEGGGAILALFDLVIYQARRTEPVSASVEFSTVKRRGNRRPIFKNSMFRTLWSSGLLYRYIVILLYCGRQSVRPNT